MLGVKDLLDKAKSATVSGKISWYNHDERENDFYSKLPDGLLLNVWTWEDPEDGESGASFSITRNEYGPAIDVLTAPLGSIYYNNVQELFQIAKRSAFNIDHIIMDIDKFLSS